MSANRAIRQILDSMFLGPVNEVAEVNPAGTGLLRANGTPLNLPGALTQDFAAKVLSLTQLTSDFTNTAAVGAVTINKAAGRVNIAAAGTSVVVTNSFVAASSKVFVSIASTDRWSPS